MLSWVAGAILSLLMQQGEEEEEGAERMWRVRSGCHPA